MNSAFIPDLWAKELHERFAKNIALSNRLVPARKPLTRWERLKLFLHFYEARRRITEACKVLVRGSTYGYG